MKTTLIAFATAMMMGMGSLAAVAPAEAATVVIKTDKMHVRHMNNRRHREVCRIVTRKKVVYRNHRRHVVVTKVRRCN